jgi:hypothetical protein
VDSPPVNSSKVCSILRRFASGQKLTPEEHAEIAEIVPATAGVVRKVTAQNYKLTLREYARQFIKLGMPDKKDNERKLKNWIHSGRFDKHKEPRDPLDLPPFDQVDQLAAWWRRCMTYKPPDWVIECEKKAAFEGEPAKNKSEPAGKTESAAAPASQAEQITGYGDLEISGEIANDFTVRILFGAAMDSKRRYEEARQIENWRQARLIREELIDDVKALQRAQVDALKVLAAKGDYLRSKETMQSLNGLLAMQDTSFYNALEEVVRVANPQMEPEQRRDLALEYRDKVFEHFHKSDFAQAWTPQEH